MPTVDVHDKKMLVSTFLWLLQGSLCSIMAYKNMGACRQFWAHINGSMGWAVESFVEI